MAQEVEERLDALLRKGDLASAATGTIEAYGPEVLGWLFAFCRDRAEAEDAFATASEDLWRGLSNFRGECSLRTWLYTLARHALVRLRLVAADKRDRKQPLSEASAVAERVRSQTAPWLRTDVKDRFVALRDELSEEDRSLLILRVDRDLAWNEVATVMTGEGEELERVSARLRKRFQSIRDRLHERAKEEGLLDDLP